MFLLSNAGGDNRTRLGSREVTRCQDTLADIDEHADTCTPEPRTAENLTKSGLQSLLHCDDSGVDFIIAVYYYAFIIYSLLDALRRGNVEGEGRPIIKYRDCLL